jgi:hypothetical protein
MRLFHFENRFAVGLSSVYLQFTFGLSLVYRWFIVGLSLVYRWFIVGLSLVYRWFVVISGSDVRFRQTQAVLSVSPEIEACTRRATQ